MIAGALLLAIAVIAWADTTPPPPTARSAYAMLSPAEPTARSAYAMLSPGDQKIARALFKAQTSTAPKTLTLDEIAAMNAGGPGWGQVFGQMEAQGLLQLEHLAQAIARNSHSTKRPRSRSTFVTTASGRTIEVETGSVR